MMFIGNIGSLMPLLMAIVTFGSVAFGWYKGNQTANDEALNLDASISIKIEASEHVSSTTVKACSTIHFFDTEPNICRQPIMVKHETAEPRCHYYHNPPLKTDTPFLYRYLGLSPPAKSIA
jgi:hypothetical protein